MSDLIRRLDAIDALEARKDKTAKGDIGQFYNTIIQHDIDTLMNLPSAQSEPQWIPCSERLPNGQTEVIVSCCDDAGDSKYNYTSFGWMTRDGEYWIVDNEINYYVNAWMPLPEPWRGAER